MADRRLPGQQCAWDAWETVVAWITLRDLSCGFTRTFIIPVDPLAMMVGLMILILSGLSLCLLLACLLAFLLPRGRRYMLARRWRFGLLVLSLAIVSVPVAWMELDHWLDWRAHNPRLEREQVLGDLVLPAGTRVTLQNLEPFNDLSGDPLPYGLQSLERADFEHTPGTIRGMSVRRLELWQGHGTAIVETLATTDQQGWRCEPGQVEFRFPFGAHFRFSEWRLYRCTLAAGTRLGGIVWPGPVKVFSSENEEWEVRSEDTPTPMLGLELLWLSMRLDRSHGTPLRWEGVLNRPARYGPVDYPEGTQVRSYRGHLLFSLPAQSSALDRRTGTPIAADHSVVQSMAGEVLGVRANQEMGVHVFDEIVAP